MDGGNPGRSVEKTGLHIAAPFDHAKVLVAPTSLQRPKAVQILLPVWGYGFVQSLLRFCIPTLLAPGNVPLLAKMLPTRFVVLTRSKDRRLIETHSSWRKLADVCDVEIRTIDDMITRDNHTACISLAFHRAILDGGACGDGTCFFLMNADFLVADGSLTNVARRMMRDGTSAVLAGNFQIVAEDAVPQLQPLVDRKSGALVMSPRDLLAFSFPRLHPVTIANTVNLGLTHNARPNRLFWRADDNTLLGRFFLAHVVAVMPERKPTTIGSSYDYSFIPEMCPSGDVDFVTDSDDYVVVEMQPREHESGQIELGPITPKQLAHGLSEWTTEQHRSNAKRTMVFHTGDVPKCSPVHAAIARFMNDTSTHLSAEPMPYRGHPYWVGSISAHHERLGRPIGQSDWIDASNNSIRHGLDALLRAAIRRVYGTRPEVTPLHPSWNWYSTISNHLKTIAPGSVGLFVCDNPTAFEAWLLGRPDIGSFEAETVNTLLRPQYMPLVERFDFCWLAITRKSASSTASLVSRIAPMLRRGGLLLVSVDKEALEDRRHVLADVLSMSLDVDSVRYVPEPSVVAALRSALKTLHGLVLTPWAPVAVLAAVPISLITSGWNMVFGRARKSFPVGRGRRASVVIAMRRPMRSDHVVPLPDHLDPEVARHTPSTEAAALVLLLKHELAGSGAAHEPADVEFATVSENVIEAREFLERFERDRGIE